MAHNAGDGEPPHGADHPSSTAHEDLLGGMVVEVDPAPRRDTSNGQANRTDGQSLEKRPGLVDTAVGAAAQDLGRAVANEEEEGEGDAPEGDELGMGAGHAVALAVDAERALLLDQALEAEVDDLAGELAGEHQGDFDFAGEEDEGRVDDAEGLGEEGEVGADEGEQVVGVLGETTKVSCKA